MSQKTKNLPNYYNVNIPENKEPKRYSTNERRAEILMLIMDKGDPNIIPRVRLAERYGVNPSTITRDFDKIAESIKYNVDTKNLEMELELSFKKAKIQALKTEDWNMYLRVVESWKSWLFESGKLVKAVDKVDVGGELNINFKMWDDDG